MVCALCAIGISTPREVLERANGMERELRLLSVVIPAYCEEEGIARTVREIVDVLEAHRAPFELLVVDDGSLDRTFAEIRALARRDPRIRGLRLCRRFGKEAALWAGLRAARGCAVVTMDADLQHPPSLLPAMIAAWRAGASVVHGVRTTPSDRSLSGLGLRRLFSRLVSRLSGVDLEGATDFKLLDRRVADVLAHRMPERNRFYRGLVAWTGYPAVALPFIPGPRRKGRSRWRAGWLVELAVAGIVSFTNAPLRIVTFLGFATLFLSAILAAETLWSWLEGSAVSGFATTILTMLFLGSFVMISLGIIGEYIAKIYDEVKQRPPFIIDRSINIDHSHCDSAELSLSTKNRDQEETTPSKS